MSLFDRTDRNCTNTISKAVDIENKIEYERSAKEILDSCSDEYIYKNQDNTADCFYQEKECPAYMSVFQIFGYKLTRVTSKGIAIMRRITKSRNSVKY